MSSLFSELTERSSIIYLFTSFVGTCYCLKTIKTVVFKSDFFVLFMTQEQKHLQSCVGLWSAG